MRYQNVVRSFRSGVWSPRVTLRSDSERYDSACLTCKNFTVTPQGGATFRHGAEYIGDIQDTANPARIFAFKSGGNQSDAIFEATDQLFRFWRDDQLIDTAAPGSPDETVTPYLQAELDDIQFANQESLAITTHPNHPPQYTRFVGEDRLTTDPLPFDSIPFINFADAKSPAGVAISTTYNIAFNGTWNENDPFLFIYNGKVNSRLFGGGEVIEIVYRYTSDTATMISTLERCCEDAADIDGINTTYTVTDASPPQNTYDILLNGPNAGRDMIFDTFVPATRTVQVTPSGVLDTGTEPVWSYPYVVFNAGGWYQCIVPHLSAADNEPAVGANWTDFWTVLPGEPSWWAYQHNSLNPWAIDQVYGPWNRGFPAAVTFHEQRLIMGGATDSSSTIVGSRVSAYDDFDLGPNASDPWVFTIDTRGSPSIKWLESNNGLLIGTSAGEFRATAEITLSPGDINVKKQNNARSHLTQPITLNFETFYIEQGKTKIRSTRFRREYVGFLSDDVSLTAEHLFYAGAKRIALLQTPEVMVAVLRDDGQLVALSYDVNMQTIGWYAQETNGTIVDIASVYSTVRNEDELYLIVQRGTTYHLERMPYPPRDFSAGQGLATYFDSYQASNNPVGGIVGLDHLEGQTVGVTDGNAWKGEFVVSGGTIPYTPVGPWAAGLRYSGEVEPLERTDEGVEFGTARRWNKLYVRLLDSALPLINGKLPEDRTPSTPMDTVEPLRSGNVKVTQLGFNDGVVNIEQDLPYPTHVLGFYGQYGRNNV